MMLKMSCNKHHLQEVTHCKRGRDANNKHRGEQAARAPKGLGRGETDIDASEYLMMVGM
jgi:ribosomal protein L44E